MANVAPVTPAATFQTSLAAIRTASSQVNHDDPTNTMNDYLVRIRAACHTFANFSTPPKHENQRPRVTEKLVSFASSQSKHAYANPTDNPHNTVINDFVTGRCTHVAPPNCVGPRIAVVSQRIGNPFGKEWHAAVVVKVEGVLLVYDPDFGINGLIAHPNPRKSNLKGLGTVNRIAEESDWKNLRWRVSGGHTFVGHQECVAECLATVTHAVGLIMDAPRVPAPDDFARD